MGVDADPFNMLCAIAECEEEQVAKDVEAEAGLNGGRLLLGLWAGKGRRIRVWYGLAAGKQWGCEDKNESCNLERGEVHP
jgi:hypothetical protein